MTHRDATSLVQALVAARLHHALLPVGDWSGALQNADDAYAVQDGVAAALGWFGPAAPCHWKSGGPSLATPLTHAPLPPAAVRESPVSFADLPLHAPAIEAEIALRLGVDVDASRAAGLTPSEVDGLVDAMTVSIEVVDSRWREGMQGAQAPVVRVGTHSLADPAAVLPQWLRHATRGAATVRAGTVVTTGTWVGVLAAARGDEVTVVFDGIGSASLAL